VSARMPSSWTSAWRSSCARHTRAGRPPASAWSSGTPAYMAPEQRAAGAQLDHKVDLYAWGLLAAEVLSGKSPRDLRDGTRELGDAPPGVALLVSDCLAKDPAARPADAGILLQRLDEATPKRRTLWKRCSRPRGRRDRGPRHRVSRAREVSARARGRSPCRSRWRPSATRPAIPRSAPGAAWRLTGSRRVSRNRGWGR
jgi:serine/threonine protein kinase